MASAEGGLVPSAVGYAEGCPLFSRLGGLGERRELPQRGPGRSPGQKRILAFSECHRTLIFVHYVTKSAGDNLHYRPPYSKFWGGRVPPVPPVIYAHARGRVCDAECVIHRCLLWFVFLTVIILVWSLPSFC